MYAFKMRPKPNLQLCFDIVVAVIRSWLWLYSEIDYDYN